uniref:Uncharacterized protein n=1 Tax=Anguilla anguilla TaxID=7936 RepID=A0A0E9V7B9_ANGAN
MFIMCCDYVHCAQYFALIMFTVLSYIAVITFLHWWRQREC